MYSATCWRSLHTLDGADWIGCWSLSGLFQGGYAPTHEVTRKASGDARNVLLRLYRALHPASRETHWPFRTKEVKGEHKTPPPVYETAYLRRLYGQENLFRATVFAGSSNSAINRAYGKIWHDMPNLLFPFYCMRVVKLRSH
ncbi:hypothetical protein NPIL_365641 [Nephila pilipes]|uniref:Uncharacterized protein n=1 Tax=Nephila pilipes TaxID=299642 RepID=A0A8X6QHV4_NEPPI|nr:hypothetical protein NPIL_365641 [Nephila pilipes]